MKTFQQYLTERRYDPAEADVEDDIADCIRNADTTNIERVDYKQDGTLSVRYKGAWWNVRVERDR